ncbi:potassium voltage-gated channel subfamily D member 3-like protein [Corchorus olitorius]|uniref:Potassium voltage-gated channel subfamily D member 3-like protein n=1 Tax=Corchorus olitorius TaxID=93759 RepID=A0A1R3JNW5_9ROSI|nr:potassium voltage-gated channel subfamily D member 3-like protein [Corchorus olitorius]
MEFASPSCWMIGSRQSPSSSPFGVSIHKACGEGIDHRFTVNGKSNLNAKDKTSSCLRCASGGIKTIPVPPPLAVEDPSKNSCHSPQGGST